ncbi:uncharacterized protein [Macrobrachium rosenbergii]|uniref:uncharacterized protein isoform X5 n=1 Tax=Macrobrachium rosenbergii TaxID=79674 RepID=UPI0034D66C7B
MVVERSCSNVEGSLILNERRIVRKKKRQCVGVHEGLLRCSSGRISSQECPHHHHPLASPASQRPSRQVHLRARSYDGSTNRQDLKSDAKNSNNKSSPIPQTRRAVNGLRQCDSLENVCDSNHDDQIENGLGLAAQPAAANALSLPHIHQLSDYDEDNTNNDSPTENDPEQEVKPTNKRSDKSKKTKLKRRRAYYRTQKDGRSKSLTHIDTLGEPGMLLPGEDMEGRSGDPSTDKLGVPDAHSVRRRKLSLANKVSSCEYMVVVLEYYVDPVEESSKHLEAPR